MNPFASPPPPPTHSQPPTQYDSHPTAAEQPAARVYTGKPYTPQSVIRSAIDSQQRRASVSANPVGVYNKYNKKKKKCVSLVQRLTRPKDEINTILLLYAPSENVRLIFSIYHSNCEYCCRPMVAEIGFWTVSTPTNLLSVWVLFIYFIPVRIRIGIMNANCGRGWGDGRNSRVNIISSPYYISYRYQVPKIVR